LGLGTLLRIKPRARRSFLTKERPSGDASGSLSQPTRIVYASEKRIAGRIRIQEAAAVWLILFFIACAVVYSVGKLIYQFWT
jgi:hypothetical protein